MLIFFDIDATLLATSRSGIHAMGRAGRELLGPGFDENRVEYAGRLDPLIIIDLLRVHGQEVTPAAIARFREAYGTHLVRVLATPGTAQPCPGVLPLLEALEAADTHVLALLTGNFPETGAIKLRASGIDPDRFALHVWGSDSPHDPPAREHLPPVGMARYTQRYARPLDPKNVIVIGDTPHDVSCARAHGCRSLGVATGRHSVDELARSGADHVLPDLSDTSEVMRWINQA